MSIKLLHFLAPKIWAKEKLELLALNRAAAILFLIFVLIKHN
jgi:hypothetical protein